MKIAIHQPNFCPYEGFWNKMRESDLFVILKFSQFRKGGFENRFNYMNKWFTMSVNKGLDPLVQKQYINHHYDWTRITHQLPKLKIFDTAIDSSLYNTNVKIIHLAQEIMKINRPIIYENKTNLTGTDRLVNICKIYGANEYLSGPSGVDYLELNKFESAGIKVVFQKPKGSKPLIELI